jgi:hypothetical protein
MLDSGDVPYDVDNEFLRRGWVTRLDVVWLKSRHFDSIQDRFAIAEKILKRIKE